MGLIGLQTTGFVYVDAGDRTCRNLNLINFCVVLHILIVSLLFMFRVRFSLSPQQWFQSVTSEDMESYKGDNRGVLGLP